MEQDFADFREALAVEARLASGRKNSSPRMSPTASDGEAPLRVWHEHRGLSQCDGVALDR